MRLIMKLVLRLNLKGCKFKEAEIIFKINIKKKSRFGFCNQNQSF